MKKRILVLVVGFLFVGINVFAADGDLIVNGNATVNGNLTVQGTIQGVKLVHVTGTNPACPSGTNPIAKKLTGNTCSDAYGYCTPTGTFWPVTTCTIPAGWSGTFTCQYNGSVNLGELGVACQFLTCSSNWTEAVCMGN